MATTATSELIAGVDLGGTNMQAAILDRQLSFVARTHEETNAAEGMEAVVSRVCKAIEKVSIQAGMAIGDLSCVGVAAPGAIDMNNGVVLESPNLRWFDVPLRDLLTERLGCDVVLDNDVNGAVWGEYCAGNLTEHGDILGIWLGTGVGGGLVLNGSLYHGTLQTAGEFGWMIVTPNGSQGFRSVEDHASRTGMSREIRRRLTDFPDSMLHRMIDAETGIVSAKNLAIALNDGDALASAVVTRAAELLGIAIASAVTLLSLGAVIIGGGVTEALGSEFVQIAKASFERNVFPDRCKACKILMTKLGPNAGLIGAALLARDTCDSVSR